LKQRRRETKDVDGRDKPGHDARGEFANLFFAVFSSIARIERLQRTFHSQCFAPNKLDFRGLESHTNKFVDRA
jgi:hypothetical protein